LNFVVMTVDYLVGGMDAVSYVLLILGTGRRRSKPDKTVRAII
jgi:hypothetical protein